MRYYVLYAQNHYNKYAGIKNETIEGVDFIADVSFIGKKYHLGNNSVLTCILILRLAYLISSTIHNYFSEFFITFYPFSLE